MAISEREAELLADGIAAASGLMDDLEHDLGKLVETYLERVKGMSLLALTLRQQNHHANPSDYSPEVLRSRIQGYLNVLASMRKPIQHDCAFYETMIHDALETLEGTKHWDRALAAYKRNLPKRD